MADADTPVQGVAEGELVAAPVADEVIDRVVEELNEQVRSSGLQATLAIGGIVVGKIYNGDVETWRSHDAKETSFRTLAKYCKDVEGGDGRLLLSAASRYRSVAIYVMCQQLGVSDWKHLGVTHLRAVLGLSLEQQRQLLTAAEDKAMSAEELERQVAALRKTDGARRGRPAQPAFVKSISALGRLIKQAEALWKTVTGVKLKCEELQKALVAKVPGFGEPADA